MRTTAHPAGFTLVETIVALLLLTIGGLALTSTSALVGRELNANALRERATRIAASRLEILAAECRSASSGREQLQSIESAWTISVIDSSRVRLLESVSYMTWKGGRTDFYLATIGCPR
jgi:prepilin-type N-terminal cleavage/methylation domain-containing protein